MLKHSTLFSKNKEFKAKSENENLSFFEFHNPARLFYANDENKKHSKWSKYKSDSKKLSDFCKEWLKLRRSTVKESTYVKYNSILKTHIIPAFGDFEPCRFSTALIEEFSYDLMNGENKLSVKTVKDILIVLNSVLKFARKQTKTENIPTDIIYPKEKHREMRVLSSDEQEVLFSSLLSDLNYVNFGILLALLSGMRIGELCALKWGDISLSDGIISVKKTMQRLQKTNDDAVRTHIVIGDAKSDASVRMIPLTKTASELCRLMKYRSDDEYILTADSVHYMEPRTLQYKFQKITNECGLNGVHFHTLRHTFATRCVEVGFEIKTLSEILGHSDVSVTLNRYVHSSMELKRTNMKKLETIGF